MFFVTFVLNDLMNRLKKGQIFIVVLIFIIPSFSTLINEFRTFDKQILPFTQHRNPIVSKSCSYRVSAVKLFAEKFGNGIM